ncbi:type I glyceraldehyde-3-phosphate dehydrogenase [Caulobacter segnis]|uniref:Glyceraldehyde-3-phosphate dehydrogenase n=2 Tax=Caulobacter segnis TaxID=88688 RepID=D5VKL3_CAUST|nr:ArsJ-associated glyceraldehyde-3-phosphate dehydrogenase [Caulobacter segnis]ADG11036.1 glyceraldehyde-3-phosphate dehydrogenase, type I [Caulobacter segnis ATCC 21756]AVQ02724.1 type I glyceraldehyde-3-phosphate dehydrogenase [Caulobacter segnis]
MKTRVGINGFGRMGRLALRQGFDHPDLEFTHINEPKGGAAVSAHLLKFDSVHGRWPHAVEARDDAIVINGMPVRFSTSATVEGIGWQDVDVVLECSGKFRTQALLEPHFAGGVRKVIVSAPVKDDVLNIVMGINDHRYDPANDHIVTAASCTTNCLAPIVKVIHENLGIRHGVVTTIHDMTNTQAVTDTPLSDLRRARAASLSLIPTTTGSATAISLIYPELKGRLNGLAVRVPLLNASLTDAVFEVEKPTSVAEVNALFKAAADGPLHGVLGYEDLPLVSVDFKGDPRSAIIDADSTMVVAGTQVKVLGWYDNETGYVARMIDLTRKIGAALALDQMAAE